MRQRMARPNIKEVASAAGVSAQTLSRVINKRPDVSPQTRKRVQTVIEALGYKPGIPTRGSISQRCYMLGGVTAGLGYSGPSRLLNGTAAAAEQAEYSLLLKEPSLPNKHNLGSIFQGLLSWHVHGLIWGFPEVVENHSAIPDAALDINAPPVFVAMAPPKNISVVAISNSRGGNWQ
jgi:LacI family transcriptional regulator